MRTRAWQLLVGLLVPALALAAGRAAGGATPGPGDHPRQRSGAERGAGFVAGPLGGIGFAYRQFGESGAGFQVGGLAYSDSSSTTAILGAEYLRTLKVMTRSRFYWLVGAMGIYSRDTVDEIVPGRLPAVFPPVAPPELRRRRVNDSSFNVGGGLGMSWGRSEGITFHLELPLAARFEDGGLESVGPIPQAGLLYNF